MENTSDTKRKSGMELEVKDGALLWQSIEIDESKKGVKKQGKMGGGAKVESEANGRRWSGRGEFVERNRDVGF